jgi:hypothetical protein
MVFFSIELFSSLHQNNKNKYIDSQIAYVANHRTILIKGIQDVNINTLSQNNNKPLQIREWLLEIPDYQGNKLFTRLTEVNNDIVELQLKASNYKIALKWSENCIYHIAKAVCQSQLSKVFSDTIDYNNHMEDNTPWEPPPIPKIDLLQNSKWTGQIPHSISQSTHSKKTTNKTAKTVEDTDTLTVATVASSTSYSQNDISDLLSESRQLSHQFDGMTTRMATIEETVQDQLATINSQIICFEHRTETVNSAQTQVTNTIDTIQNILPTLTSTMETQQHQLHNFFESQEATNQHHRGELHRLQESIRSQNEVILQLQSTLQHIQTTPSTPNSEKRTPEKTQIKDQQPTN